MDEFSAANRLNWDNRARLHASDPTGMYRIAEVLAGGDSLHAIEAGEIGDVSGRRLVHLQCHIGLDTISLAGRGAIATGLDFSVEAIAAARDFAARAGRDVRFVQSDIFEAPQALAEKYEIAYVTWGAINWLPDIRRWAKVVSEVLELGGFLYLAESHPTTLCLEEIEGRIVAHYSWRTPPERPIAQDAPLSYTGDQRTLDHTRTYEWIHPLSEIVTALTDCGLAAGVAPRARGVALPALPHDGAGRQPGPLSPARRAAPPAARLLAEGREARLRRSLRRIGIGAAPEWPARFAQGIAPPEPDVGQEMIVHLLKAAALLPAFDPKAREPRGSPKKVGGVDHGASPSTSNVPRH